MLEPVITIRSPPKGARSIYLHIWADQGMQNENMDPEDFVD
jgi:hypothetical protein